MEARTKKIVTISVITTVLAVGGFITYVALQERKYRKISETIVTYNEALDLLSEKEYTGQEVIDDMPFDPEMEYGYAPTDDIYDEYGYSEL